MPTDVLASSTEQVPATVPAPAGGDPRTSASVRTPMGLTLNAWRFAWRRLQEVVGDFLPLSSGIIPGALSVSGSTFTLTGHGLNANDPVRLWSIGGSVPPPLAQFTTYYVVGGSLTANTFQLSATSGGSAISLSGVGSGAIYGAKLTSSTFALAFASLTASIAATYATIASLAPAAFRGARTETQATILWNASSSTPSFVNASMGTGDEIDHMLDLPDGSTLTAVHAWIVPGVHGSLPQNMPTLQIWKTNATTGVSTTIGGPVTDPSGSTGAYDPAHAVTVSGLSIVIDRTTYVYWSSFINESGTNSVGGGIYAGTTATFTT